MGLVLRVRSARLLALSRELVMARKARIVCPPILRFAAPDGGQGGELPAFARDPVTLVELYRTLLRGHRLVARTAGWEAALPAAIARHQALDAQATLLASALGPDDRLLAGCRLFGAPLWHGVLPSALLPHHDLADAAGGEAATRWLLAESGAPAARSLGLALARRRLRRPGMVAALIAEPAACADLPTLLALAARWQAPVVFVLARAQDAAPDLANDPIAAQIVAARLHWQPVDGGDPIALRHAADLVLARSRSAGTPAVLDARCSQPHAAPPAERAIAEPGITEPLLAWLRQHLLAAGHWQAAAERRLLQQLDSALEDLMDQARRTTRRASAEPRRPMPRRPTLAARPERRVRQAERGEFGHA